MKTSWAVGANPKSAIRISEFLALWYLLLASCSLAHAQLTGNMSRIGVLGATPLSTNLARIEELRQGLRQLGYVEGKNIVIEWRFAEGKAGRLGELVAELLRLKVDLIVAFGPTSTRAAREATSSIPIVMAQVNDPVGAGFVTSLARPGGNITGTSVMAPDLSGKQLELLKGIVPKLSHVAVFGTSVQPGNAQSVKESELAAKALSIQLNYIDVLNPKEIETAYQTAAQRRSQAVLVLQSPVFSSQRQLLVELAMKNRLPVIYPQSDYMDAGGLMFYGPSMADSFRRTASYVDKILKGAKPAELPVEQPMKFEFVINLKAAKMLGLTIPPEIKIRVTHVIE